MGLDSAKEEEMLYFDRREILAFAASKDFFGMCCLVLNQFSLYLHTVYDFKRNS